ncbi:hypothetical protein CFB44_10135 [Burkholderia sp. AU31280]|nr:hypothetical protein CFB44_10135 [Burkholderia sp. AU31280]RQV19734.1 hypothetical protein DF132_21165 [Burkholderia cenocepacia]RQV64360.1 hypothetical protein DF024_14800 [Burkholderia cenocepacia]RQV66454.1 hypothetical protein DF018_21405 [Burkholderia cenocepacia]
MTHTIRTSIGVLALMLAMPAVAATPADNVAWSARPDATVRKPLDCSASTSTSSGWRIAGGAPPSAESVLKSVGTVLAVSALSVVSKGSMQQSGNACRPANGS